MLRTIYSLLKDCGIIQLLSSAGLEGMRAIKKDLNGEDVMEGTILQKSQNSKLGKFTRTRRNFLHCLKT